MIAKTIAAIIGGGLVSISIMLNLNYLLPLDIDTRLFVGLLLAFPLWIATMVWCYSSTGGVQAWKRCIYLLCCSATINAYFVVAG